MSNFAENLKKLPGVSHLSALNLLDAEGNIVATIENKAGSQGSLAVYNHLAQTYGAITAEAAKKGLEIFAEHSDDERANPGKHPNIARLLKIEAGGPTLRTKHVFAVRLALARTTRGVLAAPRLHGLGRGVRPRRRLRWRLR